MTKALFAPFALKSLKMQNRVVMAPMTRVFSPKGVPGPDVAAYYGRRAKGDVGLIVTEGTVVERPASKNEANIPNFYGEDALKGWGEVVKATKAHSGVIAPQLWHTGAARGRDDTYRPTPLDLPSGLSISGKPLGEAMTDGDIADTIAAFAKAALSAKELGFDAIELHGAHGYLIDEFFWSQTNHRKDSYGGDTLAERARFAGDIIRACRAAVGNDFAIIIRISQWKQGFYDVKLATTEAELLAWTGALVDAGADILHCSQRRFWEPEFEGSDLNFAGWVKKLTGVPTITVGSVGLSGEFIAGFAGESSSPTDINELMRRLDRGDFDLVGVGRALLVDPEWVAKIRDGRFDELESFSPRSLATLY
jgi:2,4-dienoyl-CoA reductase-like NADH-dependent reductase (Old Yellow Enzyme family)